MENYKWSVKIGDIQLINLINLNITFNVFHFQLRAREGQMVDTVR